jgi:hypothetical protein
MSHISMRATYPAHIIFLLFFLTGFYSPYRTLAFLSGLLDPQTLVGLLGWGISPTQGLYRNTGQHNTETRRYTSMPE